MCITLTTSEQAVVSLAVAFTLLPSSHIKLSEDEQENLKSALSKLSAVVWLAE